MVSYDTNGGDQTKGGSISTSTQEMRFVLPTDWKNLVELTTIGKNFSDYGTFCRVSETGYGVAGFTWKSKKASLSLESADETLTRIVHKGWIGTGLNTPTNEYSNIHYSRGRPHWNGEEQLRIYFLLFPRWKFAQ